MKRITSQTTNKRKLLTTGDKGANPIIVGEWEENIVRLELYNKPITLRTLDNYPGKCLCSISRNNVIGIHRIVEEVAL